MNTVSMRWLPATATLSLLAALAGCGGGGSGGSNPPPPPPPPTFTISATVSGLSGTGLVLRNNGGNDLAVAANGAASFSAPVASGGAYAVTVLTQPASPSQTCTVANGSGTAAANVSNVTVTCVTNTFTVTATVTNLSGSGLILRNNGGNDLSFASNGAGTFTTAIASGANYNVTVASQPTTPSQTCTVTNGTGTVTTANISNVTVACVTNTYTVSATVSNFAGSGLVLRNNGGNDLTVLANGVSTFTAAIASGADYDVTVASHPSIPSQTCVVTNGSGTVTTANVSNVSVTCVTNMFTVSATVSNLVGSGLVLRNNGANDLAVAANGTANFSAAIASGGTYNVTVANQPASPAQVCTPVNGGGNILGANVNVAVTCGPPLYLLGGTVSGLAGSMTLMNGQTPLSVSANGAFSFGLIADQSAYSISVATQPTDYTCAVTNGAGTMSGAHVGNVVVNCTINLPGVPVVTLNAFTKRQSLDWTRPARASFYRVYKTRVTDTDYQQISGDLITSTYDDDIGLHLEDWVHVRYRVDACNTTGCTSSTPSIPQSHLPMLGYFKAGNSRVNDAFGRFTAVSGDGGTIVIAAPAESSTATSINFSPLAYTAQSSGAVYVYMRDAVLNRWVQQAHIKASNSVAGLMFGSGIRLSHDGNTLVVGAPDDLTGAPNSGSVYVFSRDAATQVWTEQANLRASNPDQNDFFGFSLAISGDGNTLLVGAPGESSDATGVSPAPVANNNAVDSGAAYVFTRSGGVWTQRHYIKASNTEGGDGFGKSVAISTDGGTLAICAPGEDSGAINVGGDELSATRQDSGAAYVFVAAGNTWVQQSYLKSPDSVPHAFTPGHAVGDSLGAAVALSGNGDTLVVSSIHESSSSSGMGGDPSRNDAQDSGAAYVFSRTGATWTPQAYVKASNPGVDDLFGFSLDLSDDGNIMAIAARNEASAAVGVGGDQLDDSAYASGAVYVFKRVGAAWSQLNYVHARSTDPFDLFGSSLGLSADGVTMIVGAPGEDGVGTTFNDQASSNTKPESGAAYIF